MSNKRIGYGVLGLGRAGWDIHIKELRDRGDAKIVAVADADAERRRQAVDELGAVAYESVQGVLGDAAVDVVVVATKSVDHSAHTLAAFAAGKHVVVEKPMGMNLTEVDQMIAGAGKASRKLFVHHNYRFRPEFTHLEDVLASGKLGRLFHIRTYTSSFFRRNDWQTLSSNGGGLLNNHVSHSLDMVLQLLGAPVETFMADLKQVASAGDVEDHVKVFLRATNGVTADIEISTSEAITGPLPKWIVCGNCGTLVSDGTTSTLKWFDPAKAAPLAAVDGPAANRKYGSSDVLPWQEQTVPSKGRDVGTFYDNVRAVLADGAAMRVTPESAREVIRLIADIRRETPFQSRGK